MSNVARRMSVGRSASGCCASPRFASLAATAPSMAAVASLAAGFTGATNAQCGSYCAPSAIHRLTSSTCSSVSRPILASGGGITLSGSSEMIRATSSLAATSSGTIAREPLSSSAVACSAVSSRSPACRLALSGPWQAKQLSERIGRMSLLNEIRAWGLAGAAANAGPAIMRATAARRISHGIRLAFEQPMRRRSCQGLPASPIQGGGPESRTGKGRSAGPSSYTR